ncbi:MAG: 16S rRNA (cytosine(967)-C(5))-methyltransferase RsmB [Lachnospiraceae bacterium]|nr:16S rRNA (cytosine(967)-C(5))-methyltransferase RsmB [Lachnospiraceae bacterium]
MTNQVNVRGLALETLTEVDRGYGYASDIIRDTLRNYQYLDKKDRAFYTRLCQGTLEYRIRLDYMINQVSNTPMKKCKPYIRNLLRMSLYQLLYMDRVSKQAVCNEAVKLAKKKGFQNLSGFVNGVLRNLIRKKEQLIVPPESDRIAYLSVMYSMPEHIVRWFLDWYPENLAETMFQRFLEKSPTCIRVNQERIGVDELREMIEQAGIRTVPGLYCDNILRIDDYNYMNRVPGYKEGYFTVQDESSCLQGYLLPIMELRRIGSARAGEIRILDLCASPGGKVMHAAERFSRELEGDSLIITARDISEHKIDRIRENLDRLGYEGIRTEIRDALQFDPSMEHNQDLVIADLPCSGLGVMGRKKDIKYHIKPEQLWELEELQRGILRNAVRYLKRGGYLIYSTCTLNPGENEKQVMWMRDELGMMTESIRQVLPEKLIKDLDGQPGTDLDQGYCTILPGLQDCDGFFMAKLRYQ